MPAPLPPPYLKTTPAHENRLALIRGLGMVPLLAYPIILLVNVMSLGSPSARGIHSVDSFLMYAFIWLSLSYPLTVVACLWFNKKRNLWIAAIPLMQLALCLLVFALVWAV